MTITPRCLICNKECDLHVTEMRKAGWFDKPVYHSLGNDMRIVICPEHNIPENYEKAVNIKRGRIARIKYEDFISNCDWYFEIGVEEAEDESDANC